MLPQSCPDYEVAQERWLLVRNLLETTFMKITGPTALTAGEIDQLMDEAWIVRLATSGPGGRINLTPLWYCWAGGRIYAYTRGRKISNLRRQPRCTMLVDRNEKYPELKGVMLEGRASVLETVNDEETDGYLDSIVRDRIGRKYQEGGFGTSRSTRNSSTAMGADWRWIVFTPEQGFSWDNSKGIRQQRIRDIGKAYAQSER